MEVDVDVLSDDAAARARYRRDEPLLLRIEAVAVWSAGDHVEATDSDLIRLFLDEESNFIAVRSRQLLDVSFTLLHAERVL